MAVVDLAHRVSLEDRYALETGTAIMTGVQALVRVPIDQRRADERAGLDTACLISGYEGSPLGGYDLELGRNAKLLTALKIVFRPALNEESGATAVMGSQQAYRRPEALHQGVIGLWYGKAPGLDRAADAIRHANLMGVHRYGGALACVGDDPTAKSSTVPSASEMSLMELMLPVLVPAYPHEVLELGLHGIALSRASGLWAGLKIATNVADGSETVAVSPQRVSPVMPDLVVDGAPYQHEVSAHMLGEQLLALERTMVGPRIEIARRYAVANNLNRVVRRGPGDRVGLVAAGKAWRDLLEALSALGLDERGLERCGIRLLKLGMPFPMDTGIVREFADGLREIIVVEEKRAFIELLLKDALYGVSGAPPIVGKLDHERRVLLPASAELDPDLIALAVGPRLLAFEDIASVRARIDQLFARRTRSDRLSPQAQTLAIRTPYFCSGCPHSTGTKVPEGAIVGGGIGCHGLALLMHKPQVGEVIGLCQMGGEGSVWVGMSPFVSSEHLIQNVGDGTFHHSGSLGVRAAVAAGVNITFKILYNSAVAMTGGQHVVGSRPVPDLTRLLASEGVVRTIVTTDDLSRYRGLELAENAELWPRSRIVEAQQALARLPGVTAMIHDQECATELRRKRKRGTVPDPATRVLINERVCEGCGDCGVKSNCLSVHPIETEFGRKTAIHQASCNKDLSCLQGDCPAFLTVTPGARASRAAAGELAGSELPDPQLHVRADRFGMRLAGIGGTGVVTVAQILALAARIDGRHIAGLDQVGLAQKYGAVISDLRIGSAPITGANKLASGQCDLYIASDLVAGTQPSSLTALSSDRSISVISMTVTPTAGQVVQVSAPVTDAENLAALIERRTRKELAVRLNAQEIATKLFGTDQVANMLLIGAAYQAGALPLSMDAIEVAIELNGVSVATNLQAIRRGRQAVCDPNALARALATLASTAYPRPITPAERRLIERIGAQPGGELRRLLDIRVPDLAGYQDLGYASRYAELVLRTRLAEVASTGESDGPMTVAVARYAHKLMAYKDEYEVARLQLDPAVNAAITAEFGAGARYVWKLHPPFLRALGMRNKISLGPWFKPGFRLLHRVRRVRGTPLDPFGHAGVRKVERELVLEYERTVDHLIAGLGPRNHAIAIEIAKLPDIIRGYEQIKLANVERYRANLTEARQQFDAG
jgi:indolepyruvate ferredoxin oxidoreductase